MCICTAASLLRGRDASNVGFILSNQRTKETHYYPCAGADEYSAMSSAEGILQQMRYTATFPLLLNISGEPTYFMAMKDNAGLVKQYAMVNVQEYQIVATGTTPEAAESAYLQLLMESGTITADDGQALIEKTQAEGTLGRDPHGGSGGEHLLLPAVGRRGRFL